MNKINIYIISNFNSSSYFNRKIKQQQKFYLNFNSFSTIQQTNTHHIMN